MFVVSCFCLAAKEIIEKYCCKEKKIHGHFLNKNNEILNNKIYRINVES
jgi:hypothetical protein